MSDIYALLDEVACSHIAASTLPFAHLAPRYTALAIHALETQLVELEHGVIKGPPHSLILLRKIAETPDCVELSTAVRTGDALLVELMIESNADVSEPTLLLRAIENGHTEIVRLLINLPLERGVNPAANTNAALYSAIKNGHVEIVRLLINLPLERGVDPAATRDVVSNFTLRPRPSSHADDALHCACYNGHTAIVRLLLDLPLDRGVNPAADDNYAFRIACDRGQTDVVRLLLDIPLDRGVAPAAVDNYAFRVASYRALQFENNEVLSLLLDVPLERGVNQEIRNSVFQTVCQLGLGNIHIVRLLINHPLNWLILDLNKAFKTACASGNIKVVRLLLDLPLERGLNPAADDNFAFRIACDRGLTDVVRLLLDLNRGVNFKDDQLSTLRKRYPDIALMHRL